MLPVTTVIQYFLCCPLATPLILSTLTITLQPQNSKPMHEATETQTVTITQISYQLEGHLNTHPQKKMTPARD